MNDNRFLTEEGNRLKQIQEKVVGHANAAKNAACAAATTDKIVYARRWVLEARKEAGGAYGCLKEARGICHRSGDMENRVLENIDLHSARAFAFAKDADKACIRLKRVFAYAGGLKA